MSVARALLAASLAALIACSPEDSPPPAQDCTVSGCPSGQSCDPATRACVEASVPCGGACPAGYVCNPSTNTCAAGTCSTATCPNGLCFSNTCHVCGANALCPAVSSACPTSQSLALALGTTTLMGSFSGGSTGLVSSSYYTVVLRLDVQQETMLSATMAVRGYSSLWTPVHEVRLLRSDCNAVVAISSGSPEAFSARYLAPGSYYLLVSGEGDAASWLVTLQASAAVQPEGNSCAAPLPFTWDGATGAVSVFGSAAGNDQATWYGCDEYSGKVYPDVIYRLDLPVASYVNLSTLSTPLTLATDCDARQSCYGNTITRSPLPAGTYYVIASTTAGGSFNVTGTIYPWATNATCATPALIDLSSGTATVTGNLQYADPGTSVACVTGDTLYSILDYELSTTAFGDQSLEVAVTRPGGGASYGVALQRACESASLVDVLACAPGQPSPATSSTLSVDVLPPGRYWLSVGDYVGPFSMTVTRGPPRYAIPANDTCAAPAQIAITSSSTYTLSGDTRGADDTVGGACGGIDPGAGNDVAFRATYLGRGWLTLRVTPSASLDAVLRVDPGCTGTPVGACANDAGQGVAEELVLPITSGSETAFWVDGAGGTAGTFTVSAQYRAASSYDTCAGVVYSSLVPGQVVPDDLRNAFADGAGACAAAGPDIFYAYLNSGNGPQDVSFTVQPNGFDAALRVLSSCEVSTCPALVNSAGSGGAETTTPVRVASGARVFVQVTTVDGSAPGAFTVSVTAN